jgi:hypothetical protein
MITLHVRRNHDPDVGNESLTEVEAPPPELPPGRQGPMSLRGPSEEWTVQEALHPPIYQPANKPPAASSIQATDVSKPSI